MDKIAIFLGNYLNVSETFIYQRIMNFRSFSPIVLSYSVSNEKTFPCERIYSMHSERSLIAQLKRTLFANFGWSPLFDDAIKDNDVKLIQAHFAPRAIEAQRLSLRFSIPQVNFFHGSDLDPFLRTDNGIKRIRSLIDESAMNITNSNDMKERLLRLGMNGEKIMVNYAGIDLDLFAYHGDRPGARKAKKILICSRLHWKKGVEFGLKAFAIALKKQPELELKIIGSGELRERLGSMAGELGIKDNVKFLGQMSSGQICDRMKSSDIMIVPSVEDAGAPNVIKEAMAVGLPVIASRTGGIPEIVRDGINGLLAEKENPEDLADKLARLIEDPEQMARFRRSGRRTVEENFDVKKQMAAIESLYKEIIEKWKK